MTREQTRNDPQARISLDVDAMVAEAAVRAGSSPGSRFRADLDQLATALRTEANLTPAGLAHARRALRGQLVTQAQADRLIAAHPEIESLPVHPPVFITGLHRTGTTLLQNILAEHPDVRAPRLWELLAPADLRPRHQLVRSARRYVEEYYTAAPEFRAIHQLDAHGPEECHRLTGVTFRSDIYPLRYQVPSYVTWLEHQDMRPAYEYHRTLLRCLLWQRPGHRVVLKCPTHLRHLDALADVYPDARVVWLHRAPRDSLGSLCSLTATVRAARAARVDKHEIGRHWLRHAERVLSPGRQLPSRTEILHLRYEDLIADPEVTAFRVCEFAHIPLPAHARRRLRRFIRRDPQERHGVHRYSVSEYGLDPDQLDQTFAAYRAKFCL